MPKFLYINPVGTDAFDEHFRRILESAARPDTEIEVVSFQPLYGNLIDVNFYIGETIRAAVEAEKNDYNAVIIGCASDPGLRVSRKTVNIPLVAPAEACLHAASMMGRFSAIVPNRLTSLPGLAQGYGLSQNLISLKSANIFRPSNENTIAVQDPKKHKQMILDLFHIAMVKIVPKLVRSAVNEDLARGIIFGCTFFSGWAEERKAIAEEFEVRILDPVITSLRVAEMLVDI